MHLAFVIFQGIGLAVAAGIRPFLPALLAGALAAGNLGVDFDHTKFSFLEKTPFLFAVAVALVAYVIAQRRLGPQQVEGGPIGATVGGVGVGIGALLFAGSMADEHHPAWIGLIAGLACAALAHVATRSLFSRVRARLDRAAAAALPVYGEGTGLIVAGGSVLAPPFGLVALVFVAWLLVTGRRREGRKYAGLRVLR